MKDTIAELWHGTICQQTESRNNTPALKELMEYMARHHESLLKSITDEQKDILERFDDCWSEYASLAEEAIFVYAFRLGAQSDSPKQGEMTMRLCRVVISTMRRLRGTGMLWNFSLKIPLLLPASTT